MKVKIDLYFSVDVETIEEQLEALKMAIEDGAEAYHGYAKVNSIELEEE